MNRQNLAYICALLDEDFISMIHRASSRYGPCTDYVLQTTQALRAAGIRDQHLDTISLRIEADSCVLPEN